MIHALGVRWEDTLPTAEGTVMVAHLKPVVTGLALAETLNQLSKNRVRLTPARPVG